MDSTEQTSGTAKKSQRKFILALMAMTTSCIAVMLGKITGGEFAMCLGAILSLYGASNVADKFVNKP